MKRVCADVVVDLQFGDCGKGKVVHCLASEREYTHVMRFNGGFNAGHTIYHEGKKFVTHLTPAGVFHGIRSVVAGACVVDVDKLLQEIKDLEKLGIPASDLLRVASNAHITTRKHVAEEENEQKIGTTRTGNGPAYRDKHARIGRRAIDDPRLSHLLTDPYLELWGSDADVYVLMEGAQGFGLDVDWGDYPYVSSSSCTVAGAVNAGIPPQSVMEIVGVAKPYVTYVGTKKFSGDHPGLAEIQRVGQEFGATTGRLRQCNWLHLPLLSMAANVNGVNKLIMNKIDVLEAVGEFRAFVDDSRDSIKFSSVEKFKTFVEDYMFSKCPNILDGEIIWSSSPEKI
jgi:adenylosuccinate synthase